MNFDFELELYSREEKIDYDYCIIRKSQYFISCKTHIRPTRLLAKSSMSLVEFTSKIYDYIL